MPLNLRKPLSYVILSPFYEEIPWPIQYYSKTLNPCSPALSYMFVHAGIHQHIRHIRATSPRRKSSAPWSFRPWSNRCISSPTAGGVSGGSARHAAENPVPAVTPLEAAGQYEQAHGLNEADVFLDMMAF